MFNGSIITTGRSEAIRLDKALFTAHPEFRQRAKVRADVIGHDKLLISLVGEADSAETEEDDPGVSAFLNFLERDLATRPNRVCPLSATSIAVAVDLIKNVAVSDDDDENFR